ncbi:P-loop ATPase, Sll1717 family [Mycobacterium sp.]|uniref:P-loop ATPase, Sll1717 family n=1 Tax=Mycobacterium sp. TaxID=1785 RepID=UPI002D9C2A0B|nr:hypothetical protein [Mycobacterium sp.]
MNWTDTQHRKERRQLKPPYKDLYFGKSDSRNEVSEDEEEFVKSYVDLKDASKSVMSGKIFLVLGPKGTGKSALGWYLRTTESFGTHLALLRDASSLPLDEVPRLQTGQTAGPERTVVAWKFILLCNYLELLLRDQGCSLRSNNEVMRVARALRDYGLTSDTSGRALLKISDTTVTIPVPKLGNIYKRESKSKLNIYNLLPYMEEWVSNAESETRHILLLDGLDSIFLNDAKYDESLASLVQAAYEINQVLQFNHATGTVVLLLRNDVFSRIALSLPDSQKMRDDLALELDWRVLSGSAGVKAPLLQLVNTKAARALDLETVDVLSYFPPYVTLGGRTGIPKSMPTLQYLLNMTRHTPRDLLRLFEEIRKVEESEIYPPSTTKLAEEVIREGVIQYSAKYFIGAIMNEFAGNKVGVESATTAMTALKNMYKQIFDRAEFTKALEEAGGAALDTDKLLTLLFYAGAIGNYVQRQDRESYLQFYHRRDDSQIYLRGKFILHNALIHAWGGHHGF